MIERLNFILKIHHIVEAYELLCKPVCEEYNIHPLALKILMILASRSDLVTAHEISREGALKPSIISFHVDKLVRSGYLCRQYMDGDRRSIKLVCTDQASPVIQRGQEVYESFIKYLSRGLTETETEYFLQIFDKVEENACMVRNGLERPRSIPTP